MSRDCDAIGCATRTQMGRFLCLHHWRMVPIEGQRMITDRYRAHRKGLAFLSDLTYLWACVQAIEGIARAEGRPVEVTSYHRLLLAAQRCASSAKGA